MLAFLNGHPWLYGTAIFHVDQECNLHAVHGHRCDWLPARVYVYIESVSNVTLISITFCEWMCCHVLQCDAVHCSMLQYVAVCFSVLQCIKFTSIMHTIKRDSTLQHTAAHCNTLQHTAAHCSTLQHTEGHCSTLQYTATHVSQAYNLRAAHGHCCNRLTTSLWVGPNRISSQLPVSDWSEWCHICHLFRWQKMWRVKSVTFLGRMWRSRTRKYFF